MMLENGYVYKKEADRSLLNWGCGYTGHFLDGIKDFISRGESKDINLVLDGNTYKAKLVNQKFNEKKYPNHRDILRIRYSPNSELADKIRNIFFCTYNYLCEQRGIEKVSGKRYFKIPEEKKSFLLFIRRNTRIPTCWNTLLKLKRQKPESF